MSILDIPPHSKRASRLALGALALVAVASFALGILRQPDLAAPAPPPPTDAAGSAIAEARPIAPSSLLFAQAPKPRRAAPVDLTDVLPDPDANPATAPPAQTAPAVDAAATAPEPPAPAKSAPAPEPPAEPPT